ncbi:hypothetical protein GCM10022295_55630 [Streptomyces osmaniensis]|uniref:Uncharacterized protein n=1 Tax=Streptomyces osmaniensis TaxID=593134 RepID=A0ABP6XL70_9ACTN
MEGRATQNAVQRERRLKRAGESRPTLDIAPRTSANTAESKGRREQRPGNATAAESVGERDAGPGRSPRTTGTQRVPGSGHGGDAPPSCASYARAVGPDPL